MRERRVYDGLSSVPTVKPGSGGSRFVDKMQLVYDEDGCKHLQKVGETDHYALIQSYRESVDLKKILERCMATGDASALQKAQGLYMDITGMPCDPRTAHDLLAHSRLVYEGLSTKQKSLYPTFDDFLEAFSSEQNIKQFVQDSQIESPVAAPIEPAAEEGVCT